MSSDVITVVGVVIAVGVALFVVKTIASAMKGSEKAPAPGWKLTCTKNACPAAGQVQVSKYVKKCSNCGEKLY